MFLRLLFESFRRQRRRKLLAGAAIFLGATAVTAMLALATTIGDRIHRELAVYGANLTVTPEADALAVKVGGVDLKPSTGGAYLREGDLVKLRTIFWANNITGVSPELPLTVSARFPDTPETNLVVQATAYWFDHDLNGLRTGAPALHPWWRVNGAWPHESTDPPIRVRNEPDLAIGAKLAAAQHLHVGDAVFIADGRGGARIRASVAGIVSTGDSLENQIFLTLQDAHRLGLASLGGDLRGTNTAVSPDAVSRVDVAAKTRPEDAFARRDPDTLSPKQRDLWYCRPYANSIAFQIREAIPGANAEQIRQVEQSEGTVLARISGLMWLISGAALISAGFAVSAAISTAVLERQAEVGLMRSLGASRASIAFLFYTEAAILALISGTLGFLAGSGLAAWLGARVFASEPESAAQLLQAGCLNLVLLPVVLGLVLLVALLGSTPAVRQALDAEPSAILRVSA